LAAIARVRSVATAATKEATSSTSKPTLIEIPSDSDSDIEFISSTRPSYKPVPAKADSDDSDVELVPGPSKTKSKASTKVATTLNLDKLSKESRQTSKRAKEERKSQLKALSVRAQKGLLSEAEKVEYATLRAMEAKKGNGKNDDGCLVI
jgi:hypothetical protein